MCEWGWQTEADVISSYVKISGTAVKSEPVLLYVTVTRSDLCSATWQQSSRSFLRKYGGHKITWVCLPWMEACLPNLVICARLKGDDSGLLQVRKLKECVFSVDINIWNSRTYSWHPMARLSSSFVSSCVTHGITTLPSFIIYTLRASWRESLLMLFFLRQWRPSLGYTNR